MSTPRERAAYVARVHRRLHLAAVACRVQCIVSLLVGVAGLFAALARDPVGPFLLDGGVLCAALLDYCSFRTAASLASIHRFIQEGVWDD